MVNKDVALVRTHAARPDLMRRLRGLFVQDAPALDHETAARELRERSAWFRAREKR